MSNNYFAPNKSGNGGALFATFNSREGFVMFRILKQNGPMGSEKVFDGQNPLFLKLSQDEVGAMIRTVRTNGEVKFYHKFNDVVTSGVFKYYKTNEGREGFGLAIKKTQNGNDVEVKLGFSLGSAERLSIFLTQALNHIIDSEHAEEVKKQKIYEKNKKSVSVNEEYIPKEEEKETKEEKDLDF